MTRVNPDRIQSEFERTNRKEIRESTIEPSGWENPNIYIKKGFSYEFRMKRPEIDAQGAIDAYYYEEGMRQKIFYPYLPCTFFDIGSAHGAWTLPALAMGARVYAFDPDPRWCKSLDDSVEINSDSGFRERFSLFQNAVADRNYRAQEMDELEDVPCVTLDDFVKRTSVVPDYIKIDTEGFESRVIEGAMNILKQHHPRLLVEHHPQVTGKEPGIWICETLQDIGYIFHPLRQRTDWVNWTYWDTDDTLPFHFILKRDEKDDRSMRGFLSR